jgi:hypothetical protein
MPWDPGRILLSLERPAPPNGPLLVSENYYPGWRVRVDGKETSDGRVEYVPMGLELPSSAQKVEIAFTIPRHERRNVITVVAILVASLSGRWRPGHSTGIERIEQGREVELFLERAVNAALLMLANSPSLGRQRPRRGPTA